MLLIYTAFYVISSLYHFNELINLLEIGNCVSALLRLSTTIILSDKIEIVTHFHASNGKKVFKKVHTEISGIDAFYICIMALLFKWIIMEWQRNRDGRYFVLYDLNGWE